MQGRAAPIFLLGIAQRSGTHYLYDALLLHPGISPALVTNDDPAHPSWEDHLLSEADGLRTYVDRVERRWNLDAEHAAAASAELLSALGDGIASFLSHTAEEGGGQARQRPLTKTPAMFNVDMFDDLFPDASLVVIVRDPRAVVASSLASFGNRAERWIRVWKRNAELLLRFAEDAPDRVTIIRYEELYTDPVGAIKALLGDLALDHHDYDFDGLLRLPVRGSSRAAGWTPIAPPPDFDPLSRGASLPRGVETRLEWILGPELASLGYGGKAAPPGLPDRATQRLLDVRWSAGRTGHRVWAATLAGVAAYRHSGGPSAPSYVPVATTRASASVRKRSTIRSQSRPAAPSRPRAE